MTVTEGVEEFQLRERLEYDPNDDSITVAQHTDKIILPERILKVLVEEQKRIGLTSLPHPLVFRLSTFSSNTYVGVREFHGLETQNRIFLSKDVRNRLGIEGISNVSILNLELALNVSGLNEEEGKTSIDITPREIYKDVTDWKIFLEATLSSKYTAVTTGDVLEFEVNAKSYVLDVTAVKSWNSIRTVCVVDRDVELNVRGESLDSDNNDNEVIGVNETEGTLQKGQWYAFEFDNKKVVIDGEFLTGTDILVGPESFDFCSLGTLDKSVTGKKTVYVLGKNGGPCTFKVTDIQSKLDEADKMRVSEIDDDSDFKTCPSCRKRVAVQSFTMHTNFCSRNTVSCSKCHRTFMKSIPESHWVCCDVCGDELSSYELHQQYYHTSRRCECGEFEGKSVDVCVHRYRDCKLGLHFCRYCHLLLPRGESCPESRYHQCSRHEWECGSKTTTCEKCGKFIQLRMMERHLKIHDIQRKTQVCPRICHNEFCVNVLKSDDFELCTLCYAGIYSSVADPDGKKLRARIERKYVMQLKNGCGNSKCINEYCATSETCLVNETDRSSMATIVKFVKNNDQLTVPGTYYFCVLTKMYERWAYVRGFLEIFPNEWSFEWVCASNDKVGNDVEKMRGWLVEKAVGIEE